ncbi:HNH endonuclease signature motif containing protein, partial [Modestobacter sp. NPDC049651]|uniref:HNH endonuclease signature motif containing protein n=1 Tax=unclassified Modestobacter TaxID=2643866 RepID=UPI003405A996
GELLATVTAAELERLVKRGCPDHPDTACGCAVLGPPPETSAYAPTAKQRAFVTTRDRRCRFPNCGQRVGWADLDHVIAHSCGGTTDCTNLCCLCRSHHRLKTFAPGWRFTMTDDGTLTVTTPSGVTRTTRPPGMRVRAPDPPPDAGRPPSPESPPIDPADDPPPF